MKRFTVAILAIIYFTISTGMVINMHYCMGKLRSVNVDVLAKNLCGCGKKETKGCCKTEHKLVKLEDNHKASVADFIFQSPVCILQNTYSLINTPLINVNEQTAYNNHSPPLLSQQDTYLRNCVFRI
jgi:CDGSH-type Zn-finger protein